MRLLENALEAAAKKIEAYEYQRDQEQIREAFARKEQLNRNKILEETNLFLNTALPRLKQHEQIAKLSATLSTHNRLENDKDALLKKELLERQSLARVEETYTTIHTNAATLFANRQKMGTGLSQKKENILAIHTQEIEEEERQLREDDDAIGYRPK